MGEKSRVSVGPLSQNEDVRIFREKEGEHHQLWLVCLEKDQRGRQARYETTLQRQEVEEGGEKFRKREKKEQVVQEIGWLTQ